MGLFVFEGVVGGAHRWAFSIRRILGLAGIGVVVREGPG